MSDRAVQPLELAVEDVEVAQTRVDHRAFVAGSCCSASHPRTPNRSLIGGAA